MSSIPSEKMDLDSDNDMDVDAAPPRCVTAIVIGAGNRGSVYTQYALEVPAAMKVVAVAEPRAYYRKLMQQRHGIPDSLAFSSWEQLRDNPKIADAAIIATQDSMHVGPAVAFAGMGYHILLEKPMSVSPLECARIVDAVKAAGVMFAVGHVLRYTPYMQRIIEIIRSGAIGKVVNIQHLEPIGHRHFAHSYVRGSWRREDTSSFMLMTKCCHDVDLLRYMIGERCARVSSFGSLTHFTADNKPAGATSRCLDCPVEASCAFSAKKIYLDRAVTSGHFGWPTSVLLDGEPSVEAVQKALREGPYGRCVYECDNDVVDHQVVNMEFVGGATATLTTVAFSEKQCQRHTLIFGTKGQLDGDGEHVIQHFDFLTGETKTIEAGGAPDSSRMTGHGGADYFLIRSFIEAIATGDASRILSGPDETLESHLMVFAAEKARHTGTVVNVADIPLDTSAAAMLSW